MGTYIDDERQSPRPPGPRPAGLAANASSAASHRLNGSLWPRFSPLAPCRWGVCGQSILIFRRGRALDRRSASSCDSPGAPGLYCSPLYCSLLFGRRHACPEILPRPTSLIPMRGIRGEVAAHDLVQLDIHIMRMAVPGDL